MLYYILGVMTGLILSFFIGACLYIFRLETHKAMRKLTENHDQAEIVNTTNILDEIIPSNHEYTTDRQQDIF